MSVTKAQLVGGVGISTVGDLSVYGGLNVTGVVTATTFIGDGSGMSGISSVSFATTSYVLAGTPNITVGFITATGASISGDVTVGGNVSIAGTLTYEDVTNIDSIGIVTARSGIVLGPTANTVQLGTGTTISSPASDTFTILTGGSERVRVDSFGRALFGTSSALNVGLTAGFSGFQIASTTVASTIQQSRFSNDASGTFFITSKSRGALGVNNTVNNGDSLGSWSFTGADGTNYIEAVRIRAEVDGTPGPNDMPGRLVFSTTADGASTPTERARIDSSGRFGLGISSPQAQLDVAATNPTLRLTSTFNGNPTVGNSLAALDFYGSDTSGAGAGVNCFVRAVYEDTFGADVGLAFGTTSNNGTGTEKCRISNSGGFSVGTTADPGAGAIYATGDITAFYSSDIRLKKDIEPISEPIKKLMEISGVTYKWNEEYLKNKDVDGYFVRETEVGVIAQEVEKVLPEVVATRENGYKAVRYEKLVALLIEAVKDQQHQIDELKARLEEK